MIILITMKETNPKTNREETIVSHGVDSKTGKTVILPCETLSYFQSGCGAYYEPSVGEYVLPDVETKESTKATKVDDIFI